VEREREERGKRERRDPLSLSLSLFKHFVRARALSAYRPPPFAARSPHAPPLPPEPPHPPRTKPGSRKPHELYGKFTWRIDDFTGTSKRELRSQQFDVGGYKWCVPS
jgi:hypothetical protein